MSKQTRLRAATRRPSPTTSSPAAGTGASTPRAPRGSSSARPHSETWTIGDLMDYASEMGFTVELTRLTDTPRK